MDVPEAREDSYSEIATYYYTTDHRGRPFNLRDSSKSLIWWIRSYPFGEIFRDDIFDGPDPYVARIFEGYTTVEGHLAVKPAGPGIDVTFDDLSGQGLVWPTSDYSGSGGGSSITVPTDNNSVSLAYWAPMPNQPNLGTLRASIDGGYASFYTYLTSYNLVSMEVLGRDGNVRQLPEGGLALTADDELRLWVKNPLMIDYYVMVDFTPLNEGDDPVVLDVVGPGVIVDDNNHYLLHVPAKDAGGYVQFLYQFKLNNDSDGADMKVTPFYVMNGDSFYESGKPVLKADGDFETLEEYDFRVGCVKLKMIDVRRDVWVAWAREFDLYNGFEGKKVPDPEWVKGDREGIPGKEHYGDSITAPTAVLKGEKLNFKVTYYCSGLKSFKIGAVCDGSTASNSCPYGDITPEQTSCNWLQGIIYPFEILDSETSAVIMKVW